MNCRYRLISVLTILIISVTALPGADADYLTQQLELEKSLQEKISAAVERILGNDHFIVDVKAELEFLPDHRVEEVYEPAGTEPVEAIQPVSPQPEAAKPEPEGGEYEEILPGIPAKISERRLEVITEELPDDTVTVKEEAAAMLPGMESALSSGQLRKRSIARTTPMMPRIRRLDISIILHEGVHPDLVESVRQVSMVAAHFNRNRGDILSIMTTAFNEGAVSKEVAAEDIVYRPSPEEVERNDEIQGLIREIQDQIDGLTVQQSRPAEPTPTENMLLKIIDKLNTRQSIADDAEAQKLITEQKLRLQMLGKDTTRLRQLEDEIAALKLQLATRELKNGDTEGVRNESDAIFREKKELEEAISRKLDMLSETQEELMRRSPSAIPLWFWILIAILAAAVIILVSMIISKGRRHQNELSEKEQELRQDEKEMRNKILNELKKTPPAEKLNREPVAPPDPVEKRAEIEDVRKNIVNISVANPDAASRIIRDWMDENDASEKAEGTEGEEANE